MASGHSHRFRVPKDANRVTIAVEKEKNNETQIKVDKGHERQQERLKEIVGNKEVRIWKQKEGQGKDLADLNKLHMDREVIAEMAAKQEIQEKQKKERKLEIDRSRGMSGRFRPNYAAWEDRRQKAVIFCLVESF